MIYFANLKSSIKKRDTAWKRVLYRALKSVMHFHIPPIPAIHLTLHAVVRTVSYVFFKIVKGLYWQPVFLCRLSNRPKRLFLYGRGLPYIAGAVDIEMGDDCRVATQISISGRTSSRLRPKLSVGKNVDIGWGTGLYVGTLIRIGDNVRIAGQGTLAGYPGHPLDATARARGEPERDDQARDIVLEDDVWLAKGVIVNAGVTVGKGTVVAAGSVVTKSLPPGVLAGGVPCRVIRRIQEDADGADNHRYQEVA